MRAIIAIAIAVAAPALSQTFDFESGLSGWTRTGTAFDSQPVAATQLKTHTYFTVKLGGDYWNNVTYPLGQHGEYLVTSGGEQGNSATGTLTSPEFQLNHSRPYYSFRVGGTNDSARENLLLEVRAADGNYQLVSTATGDGAAGMRQKTVRLPESVLGLPARIRIVDASEQGYINVDYIQFTATSPEPFQTPVWGYADYHTHPMSYMAFGELKTPSVPALFGKPGDNVANYRDNDDYSYKNVAKDIPYCPPRHNGGYMAEQFINEAQVLPDKLGINIIAFIFPHGRSGGPQFHNFPEHLMGAHQQMHITQIRRNYEGGLRLMVALATDNMGAEALTSYVTKGHVDLVSEQVSLESQVKGMKDLALANSSWMKIADSAESARSIILQNKLAVILGVEVDQLGSYHFESPEKEVDYLWQMGVRAVTPIHAANNNIGGPAVFVPAYNWLTDYLNRAAEPPNPELNPQDATARELQHGSFRKDAFFQVKPDDEICVKDRVVDKRGECVMFRLSPDQYRVAVRRPFYTLFRPVAWILGTHVDAYALSPGYGQKNHLGLTPYGRQYIAALMKKGMILDTAHMSDLSVSQTYDVIGELLRTRRPECSSFGFDKAVPPSCDGDAYPAIISHAHFRAQAIYDPSESIDAFLPSEYDISERNLEMVRRTGGVVGPFVSEGRIADSNIPGITNDCGMSSKNFAFSFRYAFEKLGAGIGMATDFTFIPTTVPRFGSEACQGYKPYTTHARQEYTRHSERYNRRQRAEECGIAYDNVNQPGVNVCQNQVLMHPYRMDGRTYNFNTDGLAHYGLVPDLLQDLKNLGVPAYDFDELFSSAEAYLKMWSKVERLADQPNPSSIQ
jgi:microsomal dipeptidase-like Zn-dependent dipeptidase